VIERVHEENYGVYGIRKMHAQLAREEVLAGQQPVARCTTQRLMNELGLQGVSRSKGPRTTVASKDPDTRPDLVERAFTADRPDCLWVADIERHEALLNPAVVKGHRWRPVAAGR